MSIVGSIASVVAGPVAGKVVDKIANAAHAVETKLTGTAGPSVADDTRLSTKENLKAAADKFEAVFIGMMLKSMRATKLGDGLLDNSASEQFRDMQDDKIAQSMAATAPLGLGKALSDFLSKSQPSLQDAAKVSATSAVDPGMVAGAS